jgi:hypothetical protein
VCSNAQDLGVRMSRFETLQAQSIFCATAHAINRDFPALIRCYGNLGFTDECSLLWAHFGATNLLCASFCVADPISLVIELHEAAPMCALLPCLNCSSSLFEDDFNSLAGRSVQNSGFNDDIPSSCDSFSLIEDHDPCVGAAPTFSPAPAGAPTMSPIGTKSAAAAGEWGLSLGSIMMMVLPILVLIAGV